MSPRRVAMIGVVATVLGFFLVFLPIFQNPILWSVPTTAPAPDYVLIGLLLFIIGSAVLVYSAFVFTWRNEKMQERRAKSIASYKFSYIPAMAGTITFLFVEVVTRLIFPNPQGFTSSPTFSIGTLFLSAIVAFSIAWNLVRYYDRIPFENPITKSVVLSTLALLILGGLSTLASGNDAFYFTVYIVYGAATFTSTGLVVGLVYQRRYGRQSPPILEASLSKPRRQWLYILPVIAVIGLIVFYSMYQESLQPVSFTASDIHFMVSGGSIEVIANITNTSGAAIIQL